MAVHKINSDSLGEISPALMARFARFCDAVAEKAGFSITFEIDSRSAGWSPASVGGQITNICWDCDWYGRGPFSQIAVSQAAFRVNSAVGDGHDE